MFVCMNRGNGIAKLENYAEIENGGENMLNNFCDCIDSNVQHEMETEKKYPKFIYMHFGIYNMPYSISIFCRIFKSKLSNFCRHLDKLETSNMQMLNELQLNLIECSFWYIDMRILRSAAGIYLTFLV